MTNPYPGTGLPSLSPTTGITSETFSAFRRASGPLNRPNLFPGGATNSATRDGEHPSQPSSATHSRNASRSMEMDGQSGGPSWKKPAAGAWTDKMEEDLQPFFTPSYLRHSRHVQQLHRAYDERAARIREEALLHPPKQPSLSTSSSHVNLSKLNASHISLHSGYAHRPPVQDVIERLPPASAEDNTHYLPSRWNEEDKMGGLEILSDGTEVRFNGVTKTSDEAASIRSDHPMPKECGLYYFEVTILSKGKDGLIGIGFSSKKANLNRLPGWETDSWAYHGDDGYSFACTASGKAYGPRFASQDVIGCGVNFRTGTAFFTKNGVYLGTAFNAVKVDRLFPSVGMKKPGEHLRINFGRTPFVFDIDRVMDQERQNIQRHIGRYDISELHAPDDESTLIHRLVGQYLAHEGYVETAKAFAQDVHDEQQLLATNPQPFRSVDSEDDIHSINRQKIRKSILDGDIEKALKYASTYYPNILEEERNKDIYFRLKCRKFIEMMRRHTEMVTATSSPSAVTKSIDSLASNGHAEHESDAQMELDDQLNRESSRNPVPTDDIDMDASQDLPPKSSFMRESNLLNSVIAYGQELQHEFGSDPRPHVKKQLTDLFAIVAYQNPSESPIGAMLDPQGRVQIAEDVNGAILVSLGKPSAAALETLCGQTEALLDESAERTGGAAAFVNVRLDYLRS